MDREKFKDFAMKVGPVCKWLLGILVVALVIVISAAWHDVYAAKIHENSETTWLSEFYEHLEDEADVGNDGEFLQFCMDEYPETVFDKADWETYDDVIASFTENRDRWKILDLDSVKDAFITWRKCLTGWQCYIIVPDYPAVWESMDYSLVSGWLYLNGVRVTAYDKTFTSLDPVEIIKAYQYGDWSGPGCLRSADYGTTVAISDGKINYFYVEKLYPEGTHGVEAYTDYEKPWWMDENAEWSARIVDSGYEEDECGASGFCETDYYLDLPIEYDPGKIYATGYYGKEYISNSDDSGTFFLMEDGALQYSRGELLEKWDFAVSSQDVENCFVVPVSNWNAQDYLAYVYNGGQLIALKKSGKYDVLMEQVVSSAARGRFSSLFGLLDNNLVYWSDGEYIILDEDVLVADFTKVKVFEKSDGCYAIVGEDIYSEITYPDSWEIVYLGEEPLAFYLDLYAKLESGRYIE